MNTFEIKFAVKMVGTPTKLSTLDKSGHPEFLRIYDMSSAPKDALKYLKDSKHYDPKKKSFTTKFGARGTDMICRVHDWNEKIYIDFNKNEADTMAEFIAETAEERTLVAHHKMSRYLKSTVSLPAEQEKE